jgi:hypothetical protein
VNQLFHRQERSCYYKTRFDLHLSSIQRAAMTVSLCAAV